ncbi:PREDICTED: subtilisin-like protease SBT1.1 [Theobroma cacao]|uniref:Subtilisin-like protease SBT1.1 n=1 Tax=Theobroma cacao TaxID=3641 RepID=A0AB32VV76_THECC|nr:PREDICTED: subtilisin-like protease SBT1.1 [Theobroma cacao]
METVTRIFIATLLILAFVAVSSTAQANKQTYIVHLDRTKIKTAYQSLDNSRPWYEAMLNSIADVSSQEEDESEAAPPQLLYAYETIMFGFAARLSSKQLELLSKIDGFQYASLDEELISLHTTHSPQFLGLEKGKGLWHASNLKSDVIIGVVDTGIWPEHPSFQDHGLSAIPSRWKGACMKGTKFSSSNCNRKLIGAKFFFKGYEAIGGKINETEDFKSARDSNGHGTHTASTAAGSLVENASLFGLANGSAAGLRYTSRIAVYKACWATCTTPDVLAAMEQAILDGVDVLSLSLGAAVQPYYRDLLALASFWAIANGIFVSFSAGNEGPSKSTVKNTAPWIMTVGASSVDRSFPTIVKLGNGQTFEGSSLSVGKGTEKLPLVYGKTAGGQGAEYCIAGSLNRKLVQGKMVVCQRGKNARAEKGEVVKMAGGAGMLLINTEREGEELLADSHVLPATSLGASAGNALKKYMNSTKSPTASIAFKGTTYGNRAPIAAALSSRGPNLVGLDVIKPDVTAPGVNILAAWPAITSPNELKSDKRRVLFNIVTGTSMSCPHVSGIAALLKSRHKDWSPAAIKSALMTTSYVTDNKGSPILDVAFSSSATPFALGSGHVDPERASDPGLIYDISPKDYIYYLCSLKYNASQISLFVDNFTCPKHAIMQPGDLNYPSFAVNFKSSAAENVTYKRTVTNVGTPKSTYKVLVEEPKGVSVIVKPKILTFKMLGEKLSYKVTFIGLKRTKPVAASSFGSLVWVSGKYRVRSPIAASWM